MTGYTRVGDCASYCRWLLCAAILLVCSAGVHAQGFGPGFHASASGNQDCPTASAVTVSSETPPATAGPITFPCTSGDGTAAAHAGAGTLGSYAQARHAGAGTASGSGAQARVQFQDVVITGPPTDGSPIPVSLNFHLKGTLNTGPAFGGVGITLFVTFGGLHKSEISLTSTNVINQEGLFAPLAVAPPVVAIDGGFTTPARLVTPNQPLYLEIQIITGSSTFGADLAPTEADFFNGSNGFSFPVGMDVFNLPEGYTVSIPSLNIVGNRWQPPTPQGISVSPLDFNFGSVTLGAQSTTVVTATNAGGADLEVSAATMGAGSAAFSILSVKKDGVGVTPPLTLGNGETLDIEIAFAPTAVGVASRSLVIESDDPDNGTVVVQLSGEGVQVQGPPSQQIAELLEVFDDAVAAGSLQGSGPAGSDEGRLKALRNMIAAAGELITDGNVVEACGQLLDVLNRIDGDPRPPDFATGAALEEVWTGVVELRSTLGCP